MTVSVAAIATRLVPAGQNTKGEVRVTLAPAIAGATVTGDWTFNGALLVAGTVGITDGSGIAVIQFNDPPANTYTYEMMRQLDEAILKARMDDAVHVILLRGAGEKFFCAGANINMLRQVTPRFKYYFCLHAIETLSRLEQTPKLVIAAINGHCVGGGLEIAMAADMRIAKKIWCAVSCRPPPIART